MSEQPAAPRVHARGRAHDRVESPETTETRADDGLNLYAICGHEIASLGEGVYAVPSERGDELYRVLYGENEHCGCADRKIHPDVVCKHLLVAVDIYHADQRQRRREHLSEGVPL
jgi:hypothetical protein